MIDRQWREGNKIELLENGEEFFPSVLEAMAQAQSEIIVETFIWFDDEIGQQLRSALISAAQRGVSVDVTIDGYGSADLGEEFVAGLISAGVRLHVFGPLPPILGYKANLFRRLHRKIAVVDHTYAWVGGINYSYEHMRGFGAKSKQDYAVKVQGPVVGDIREFCCEAIRSEHSKQGRRSLRGLLRRLPRGWEHPASGAQVLFVARDNHDRRTAIEAMYRLGLRNATSNIIIMNAYFFPGYRFLRAMRRAAQRGVRVRLILQGEPDKDYVKFAGSTLYDYLLKAGVEIWEYMERPSHAKIAVMGTQWATVGSSNLDPFSLSLNLEANLIIRDKEFVSRLRQNLETLLQQHCRRVSRDEVARRSGFWHLLRWLGYHLLRHFPRLTQLIPIKNDRLYTLESSDAPDVVRAASVGKDSR